MLILLTTQDSVTVFSGCEPHTVPRADASSLFPGHSRFAARIAVGPWTESPTHLMPLFFDFPGSWKLPLDCLSRVEAGRALWVSYWIGTQRAETRTATVLHGYNPREHRRRFDRTSSRMPERDCGSPKAWRFAHWMRATSRMGTESLLAENCLL